MKREDVNGRTGLRIGIDVGGTFTDILVIGQAPAAILRKVPTFPADICRGILDGLAAVGVDLRAVAEIAHGTTIATNALLQRQGARAGLLATEGFRDLLDLRDGRRRGLYGRQAAFEPLVPRNLRIGIPERIGANGTVLTPLDEGAVRQAATALRAAGVESVAVSFLHAPRNSVHERRTREILAAAWPGVPIHLASDLCPFPGEFLRTSTAAVAAFLNPLLGRYLQSLETGLSGADGIRLRLIDSAGGSRQPAELLDNPLSAILSGPAGGALAAAELAAVLNGTTFLTCDMGGTSLDATLVHEGQVGLVAEKELAFGVPVAMTAVDVSSFGIGGGSIARFDADGLLQIGPESAGSFPGPACFGRGGRKATLTDASLLLGRFLPETAHLGLEALEAAAARQSLLSEICPTTGKDPEQAAALVLRTAEAKMAAFLQSLLSARGLPAREVALLAFGGAGPLHAASIARMLGAPRVVVPFLATAFSALGCLLSARGRGTQVFVDRPLTDLADHELQTLVARHRPREGARLAVYAGLHRGQNPHEDIAALGEVPLTRARIGRAYRRHTGQPDGEDTIAPDIILYRLILIEEARRRDLSLEAILKETVERSRQAAAPRSSETATVVFDETPQAVPVYAIESLAPDALHRGPALVRIPGGSVLVPPATRFRADALGNLHLEVG